MTASPRVAVSEATACDPNACDDQVDSDLLEYVNPDMPRSFSLYAGAGSGKTRSLVKVLDYVRSKYRKRLILRGQRVGAITYTNAACDTIRERMDFDPLVVVSTIHSFAWDLIGAYHSDIREWLRKNLEGEIADLRSKQQKERSGSKASQERAVQVELKKRRLENLDAVRRFTYSPTGEARGRDALNHSEVIGATASLLKAKPTLQHILVGRFPILLIDESQDTIAELMEALLAVQQAHAERLCLGLFGDMMQRIYGHGMAGLQEAIPDDWARPAKQMNHRCPLRVIELINRIREETDGLRQTGRTDKREGVARLFVLPNSVSDKLSAESRVAERMSALTGDSGWKPEQKDFKTLILEHHMAARRLGFSGLFEPLYRVDRYRTGLLEGSLPGLRFFGEEILPLVLAQRQGLRFEAARVVRRYSPLLFPEGLKAMTGSQLDRLDQAKKAVDALKQLWNGGGQPTFMDVLKLVRDEQLFEIPETLESVLSGANAESQGSNEALTDEDGEEDGELSAWNDVMGKPFDEVALYQKYISDKSEFGTHQGVKGLQFSRVLVIASDEEARGFMFSYEKLFGVKKGQKRGQEEKETSIDRTRRLFYVTCSRAESSLAIVAYSSSPEEVRRMAVERGWFEADEVEVWDASLNTIH
jgi:DNA helicase II / ATP-dependent DNA helicase PcrA